MFKMKKQFFRLAKKSAQKSNSKFKLGAVVLDKKHRVLNFASNDMTKTHTKSKGWGGYIHAEFKTLLGLSIEETQGGSIYVYRELQDGSMAMSKPCSVCQEIIKQYGIKNVYYTTETGYNKL